jgi:hypothetical protein
MIGGVALGGKQGVTTLADESDSRAGAPEAHGSSCPDAPVNKRNEGPRLDRARIFGAFGTSPRAGSARNHDRVRQRVGRAGRVQYCAADRPSDQRGDETDRRGNAPGSLAASADAVWVVNTLDDTISEIDPDRTRSSIRSSGRRTLGPRGRGRGRLGGERGGRDALTDRARSSKREPTDDSRITSA